MAVKDGTDVVLKLATTLVNGTTSQNLDLSWDEIDITTKDSAKNKEFLAGEFSGTIGVEGKLDELDDYSWTELLAAAQARSAVAFVYGPQANATATVKVWTGNAIITGLSQAAPENGEVTWSCGLRITGALTEATLATTA